MSVSTIFKKKRYEYQTFSANRDPHRNPPLNKKLKKFLPLMKEINFSLP